MPKGVEIKIKGETVHTVKNRVDAVRVMSDRGELAKVNIADSDVALSLEFVEDDGLNARLEDEDERRRSRREKDVKERQKEIAKQNDSGPSDRTAKGGSEADSDKGSDK